MEIDDIVFGALTVFFIAIGAFCYYTVSDQVGAVADEKLKGDMQLGLTYLNKTYPGPWEIREGKLYKGSTLINDNHGVVDAIGASTGDTVTIFQENIRVATNVMQNGKRAVGTKVSPEVEEAVLKKAEVLPELPMLWVRKTECFISRSKTR